MTRRRVSSFRVVSVPSSRNGALSDQYLFRALPTVAKKANMSESHLRALLRKGEVQGDKVAGIWITTVAAVRTYQAQKRG